MSDVVLVTGASGFLGAHVVAAAFARSQREATRSDPYGPPIVAHSRTNALLAPRFTSPRDAADWVEHDLLEDPIALLDRERPTDIIHCAALSRAADCEQDPGRARALNAEVPGALAGWAKGHGARFVHVSTDLVFGGEDAPEGGFSEDDEPAPLSVYGESKLEGEAAVRGAHPGAWVARLALLYGNSGGRGLGASDSLLEAVEKDAQPGLFVDEWRTPLDVQCAAQALVELLDIEPGGLVHLGGPDRVSRHGLGLSVLRAMGLDRAAAEQELRAVLQSDMDTGAPRARDVSFNISKAQEGLETELLGIRAGLERAMLA